MDIYLIRHTRITGVEGICYGQSEVPLAPEFPIESLEVKEKLLDLKSPVFFSSPSKRCRALAEVLSSGEVNIVSDLMEFNFGAWELKPWTAIPQIDIENWANDLLNSPCPEGESLQVMQDRVLAFWKKIIQSENSTIILITHAGPIRIILSHLLKMPPQNMFSLKIGFGSIRKINYHDGNVELETIYDGSVILK